MAPNQNNFFILPSRLMLSSFNGPLSSTFVESVNNLTGILSIVEGSGINVATDPNNKRITISLENAASGIFVTKTGDVMSGNLQFQGLGDDEVGLILNTSNTVNEAIPGTRIAGAIYHKPSSDALRVYDGSNWRNIYLDGINTTTGDARYLKLTGGTMTGSIVLSNGSVVTLLNSTSAPATNLNGSLYFDSNTGVKQVKVLVDGTWMPLAGGTITLINTSDGISGGPISSTGTLSLDLSYSPTWLGTHTFSLPIVFSESQKLLISQLVSSLDSSIDQLGDILYFDGDFYKRLAVGSNGNVLTVSSGIPSWQTIDGASLTIGTPQHELPDDTGDTVYTDGYFGGYPLGPDNNNEFASGAGNEWTDATPISNAFDDINETLWLLADDQAETLDGKSLTHDVSPSYTFSVKLSAGLSNVWTNLDYPAGTTIDTYIVGNVESINISTPNIATAFRCGKAFRPYTYGTASLKHKTGAGTITTPLSYDMSDPLNVPQTSGIYSFNVPSVSRYNKVWAKGVAQGDIDCSAIDGFMGFAISHTEAGDGEYLNLWRDSVTMASSTPTFSVSPSVEKIRDGESKKYLSGVEYHGYQSVFDLAFEAAGGTNAQAIFNRCYNKNYIAKVFAPAGLSTSNVPDEGTNLDASESVCLPPNTPPNYNDAYTRTGLSGTQKVRVRLSIANQKSMLKYLTVNVYKATGTTAAATANAPDLTGLTPLAFCTFGSTPTDSTPCVSTESNTYANPIARTGAVFSERGYEYFTDEDKRRVAVAPFTTAWDSSLTSPVAGNGATEAQVRNGIVRYPVSTDYASYLGAAGAKKYCRRFTLVSASTGYLTIIPFDINANSATTLQSTISAYGSGDYNILLYVNGLYYDIAKNINTPGCDGTTPSTAYGAKVSISGNVVNWSIGTASTGTSGYFYLVAYFNNANIGLTSIQSDRNSP